MSHWILKLVTPNQLTVTRILIIPPLLYLIFRPEPLANYLSLGLFIFAGLTDFMDGRLARRRNKVSRLGKLLDPIADKMLVSACLVMLVHIGKADIIPAILIILREFAISGLRQVAAADGITISVGVTAKYKTTFQMVAIGFLLLFHNPFVVPTFEIGRGLLWFAMLLTLWTGYEYFRGYFKKI